MLEHVARMEEMRNAYNILIGKSERKRPLGGPGGRWDNNIRIILGNGVENCGFDSCGLVKGCCKQGNEYIHNMSDSENRLDQLIPRFQLFRL